MKIAFLASHNGSSAHAITKACGAGTLAATPLLLISNNPDAKALEWAQDAGLKTAVINVGNNLDPDQAIAHVMEANDIDLAICPGYMKLIGARTLAAVKKGILNVHPALLPRYGGKGMYGRHVHQAIFDNKDMETGITIHLVDGEYDHGKALAQKRLSLSPDHSVEDIEALVKAAEPDFYVDTIKKILKGEIAL